MRRVELGDPRLRVVVVPPLADGRRPPPAVARAVVGGDAREDAVEPGGEAGGRLVAVASARDPQERLLGEVLGGAAVGAVAAEEGEDAVAVMDDDALEGCVVAALELGHPALPRIGRDPLLHRFSGPHEGAQQPVRRVGSFGDRPLLPRDFVRFEKRS